MRNEAYIEAFEACAASALQVWDASWGTPAQVIAATVEMHETVSAAFRPPTGSCRKASCTPCRQQPRTQLRS